MKDHNDPTPRQEIIAAATALANLAGVVPAGAHNGTHDDCTLCATMRTIAGEMRVDLDRLVQAMELAHIGPDGYLAGCAVCQALLNTGQCGVAP